MMLTRDQLIEQATIRAATEYAVANGYDPNDRRAVGLVLAGMAIAVRCSPPVQAAPLASYSRQLPESVRSMDSWAKYLESIR